MTKIILILEFILFFLLGCDNNKIPKNKENSQLYTEKPINLGFIKLFNANALSDKTIWKNSLQYKIINDIFLNQKEIVDSEKTKLLNLTSMDIREYIQNIRLTQYVTIQDSLDYMNQIDTTLLIFDCVKLKNTICVSVKKYLQLFDSNTIDKGWILFNKEYGKYGIHYYSIPLVNTAKDKAIMIMGGFAYKQGSKELLFLKKNNIGKWAIYNKILIEII